MSVVLGKLCDKVDIDLSSARTDRLIPVSGDTIIVTYIDGELYVKINDVNEVSIPLHVVRYINIRPSSLGRLYISNPAQSGKKASILIGKGGTFLVEPTRSGLVGITDTSEIRINPRKEDGHGSTYTNPSFTKIVSSDGVVITPVRIDDFEAEEITVLPPATRTTSGDTTANPIDVHGKDKAVFVLDITAVSGTTPTLDVSIKGRDPVSGKWITIGSFPQQTGVNTVELDITRLKYRRIAAFYTIGGTTPSFMFSLGMVLKR